MKFLIDAQLPQSLKQLFLENGHDCILTLDLPLGNLTLDRIINKISIEEKNFDYKRQRFFSPLYYKNEPYKLIFVKMGNTSKNDLRSFFEEKFVEIISHIEKEDVVLLKKIEL